MNKLLPDGNLVPKTNSSPVQETQSPAGIFFKIKKKNHGHGSPDSLNIDGNRLSN